MDLLEECLLNRVPVNVADKTGNTPLHCASRTGQLACLERLLNVVPSVNVNAQNREKGVTFTKIVFTCSASAGHEQIDSIFFLQVPQLTNKCTLKLWS